MNLDDLPYAIEPMQLSDAPTVHSIERRVFTTPWSLQAFRQEILFHDSAIYLVLRYLGGRDDRGRPLLTKPWGTRQDANLLGYGGVWMVVDEAHVSTLAVRPSWRGQGLGEVLFAALIEQALAKGADSVTLEVRVSNRPAQALYAKYGLEQSGLRKRYYPDNQEDALIMSAEANQSAAFRERYEARVEALLQRLRMAEAQNSQEMGQASGRTGP
jgi:[ribosomal protein S18]-alanine N-acetyltransferase